MVKGVLPHGTVTFLFSDVVDSTGILESDERNAESSLSKLIERLRTVLQRRGGIQVNVAGDGLFYVFVRALDAVAGAVDAADAARHAMQAIRVGIHTGDGHLDGDSYSGLDVHIAARLVRLARPGQILLSHATAELAKCPALDLGHHRLKGLAQPVRVFQIGTESFEALESRYRSNLPYQAKRFIGRQKDLKAVRALLSKADVRLITLLGTGGVGKTRLSLEVAHACIDGFVDGVWWVELADLHNGSAVLDAIAHGVGATAPILEYLQFKSTLLILDNFEHLIDAAGSIALILRQCRQVKILVTSRIPLSISFEWRYPVNQLAKADAVRLFRARARAFGFVLKDSKSITTICERLDHLPLSIEIAAARVTVFDLNTLVSQLRDRVLSLAHVDDDSPNRHRSLKHTIQWSFDLLSDDEKRALASVVVFANGCTLEAATEVTNTSLAIFESLAAKSLLSIAQGRLMMLEAIREFVDHHVEPYEDVGALRSRHLAFYVAWLARHEPELTPFGRDVGSATRSILQDYPNLRLAIATSIHTSDASAFYLCGALRGFWLSQGYLEEGLAICNAALCKPLPVDRLWVGKTFFTAGSLSSRAAHQDAGAYFEKALAIFQEAGHQTDEAAVRAAMGHLFLINDELGLARVSFEACLLIGMTLQDFKAQADARYGLGRLHAATNDLGMARDLLTTSLALYRRIDHQTNIAIVLFVLGDIALREKHLTTAIDLLGESHLIVQRTTNAMLERTIQRGLAEALCLQGEYARAEQALFESFTSSLEANGPQRDRALSENRSGTFWSDGTEGKVRLLLWGQRDVLRPNRYPEPASGPRVGRADRSDEAFNGRIIVLPRLSKRLLSDPERSDRRGNAVDDEALSARASHRSWLTCRTSSPRRRSPSKAAVIGGR